MSDSFDIGGSVSVKADERSGRLNVLIKGGRLHTPIQLSPKQGSETESVLLDAMAYAQLHEIDGNRATPIGALVNFYRAFSGTNSFTIVLTYDRTKTQVRYTVDFAKHQVISHGPRNEDTYRALIFNAPLLKDYEFITPDPALVFKSTTDLKRGDMVLIRGNTVTVQAVKRPKPGYGESLPYAVDIHSVGGPVYNLSGGREMLQLIITPEALIYQLQDATKKRFDSGVRVKVLDRAQDRLKLIVDRDGKSWAGFIDMEARTLDLPATAPEEAIEDLFEHVSYLQGYEVLLGGQALKDPVPYQLRKLSSIEVGDLVLFGTDICTVSEVEHRSISTQLKLSYGTHGTRTVREERDYELAVISKQMADLLAEIGVSSSNVAIARQILAAGWTKS